MGLGFYLFDEPHGFRVRLRRPGMTNYLPIPEKNSVMPASLRHSRVSGNPWGCICTSATNPMDSGFGCAAQE